MAVSIGGLFNPVIGALADATDLRFTLSVLIVLPAIALVLSMFLREPAVRAVTYAAGKSSGDEPVLRTAAVEQIVAAEQVFPGPRGADVSGIGDSGIAGDDETSSSPAELGGIARDRGRDGEEVGGHRDESGSAARGGPGKAGRDGRPGDA